MAVVKFSFIIRHITSNIVEICKKCKTRPITVRNTSENITKKPILGGGGAPVYIYVTCFEICKKWKTRPITAWENGENITKKPILGGGRRSNFTSALFEAQRNFKSLALTYRLKSP